MESEVSHKGKREQPMWYPMRVTYGREESVKDALAADGVRCYLPMQKEFYEDAKGRVRHRKVPAVRNLIFIYSSRNEITAMKMFKQAYQPLRYMKDLSAESIDDDILTVPEIQMVHFINLTSREDDRVELLQYNERFFGKPGKRVVITGGDFKGIEGVIRKIKRNSRVVVELKGVIAAAIAFVPPALLKEI